MYHVFISHASEDKQEVALPLAKQLTKLGLKVWYDEYELTLGDSLRRKIDSGLLQSKFGVVVLSNNFFDKEWPQKELDALVARDDGIKKVILPIWHNISEQEIRERSPLLADKVAVRTEKGIEHVAKHIALAVKGQTTSVKKVYQEITEPYVDNANKKIFLWGAFLFVAISIIILW